MENTTYIFVPNFSSNRTAFLSKLVERTENNFQNKDANGIYPVAPFEFWENEGKMYSENPNCGMVYKLIPVPNWFTENHLNIIACRIQSELCKNYGEGSELRALKADREELILSTILKLESDLNEDPEVGYQRAMAESKKDAQRWRELYQKTTGNNAPKDSL
jgi:hypothetical protein